MNALQIFPNVIGLIGLSGGVAAIAAAKMGSGVTFPVGRRPEK
jgi:hypothetical protein